MQLSSGDGKYLGLPYMIGRSKKEILSFLRDRVAKKTRGRKKNYHYKEAKVGVIVYSNLCYVNLFIAEIFI